MKRAIKNKGLSPVIASVLMILLVLVLVTIIFSWARGFMSEKTEDSELSAGKLCSYVDFSVMIIDGGAGLEFVNRGNINISSFEIKMYSGGESEIIEIDVAVPAGASASKELGLGDVSSFDKIEIFPMLKGATNGKLFVCYKEPVLLIY